jgi:hypothetical protein
MRGTTPAQERTAARLSDAQVGAYARQCADGTLELPGGVRGAFRRYLVGRDGAAVLVEARAPLSRHAWGKGLLLGSGILAFATAGAMLVHLVEATGFAAAIVGVGLVACFVGELVMNSTITPRGRGWEKIGGADF